MEKKSEIKMFAFSNSILGRQMKPRENIISYLQKIYIYTQKS